MNTRLSIRGPESAIVELSSPAFWQEGRKAERKAARRAEDWKATMATTGQESEKAAVPRDGRKSWNV